jgi:hypothetical protein
MTNYWPTINAKETREIIQQDCYRNRAEGEAQLLNQGRFQKETAATVTGQSPISYPAIPSGPWSERDANIEPPLGYDINAVEPVEERPTPDPDDSLVPVSVEQSGGQEPISQAQTTEVGSSTSISDTAAAYSPWAAADRPEVSSPSSGRGGSDRPVPSQPSSPKPWRRRF